MKSKKTALLFRAEDNLVHALKELAFTQGYSLSEMLRIVFRAYAETKGYSFK